MNARLKTVCLIAAIGLALASTAVVARPSAQSEPIHVRQADVLTVTLAPIFIAIENGYFLEEGIDLEYIPVDNGRLGASALIAGEAQFTDLGLTDIVTLQAQDKDPILIYNLANNLTMNLVVNNDALKEMGVTRQSPLIEREQAFKGRTIGITAPGALSDLYVRYLLKQGGLDPDKDVTIVTVGGAAALLAALESGEIDAYLLSPPTPFIAEKNGTGTILIKNTAGDVPEFTGFPFNSIAVSKAWAEQNPQLVEGYCRALDRGYAFLVEHADEAIQLVHDRYFPDTPPETIQVSIEALLPAFKADGDFTEDAIRNEIGVLTSLGSIETEPDTTEGVLWTNTWNPDTLSNLALPTPEATSEGT